ncbi:MAG: hypothetical protein EOO77_17920 [Oxalobacteraceae bacterium]|nr:MAG: hypothetical protein EOO77_17920 [Oxalobacteraceae bacterium]
MRLIEFKIPSDFDQIMAQKGYEYLGHGNFTKVYGKPGSNKVIRIGDMEDAWHLYASLCRRTKNPHFPVIDKIGTRRDGHDKLLVARMERLMPIGMSPDAFAAANLPILAYVVVAIPAIWGRADWTYGNLRLAYSKEIGERPASNDPKFIQWVNALATECEPAMKQAIAAIGGMRGVTFDFKPDNFMRRQDGTLVITDPIW